MKKVSLTDSEIWFIRHAISNKNALLPLSPNALDERTFKADYGMSKAGAESIIESIKEKIA